MGVFILIAEFPLCFWKVNTLNYSKEKWLSIYGYLKSWNILVVFIQIQANHSCMSQDKVKAHKLLALYYKILITL